MAHALFADRTDAGRQLAARLLPLKDQKPLILALPRGGVPVAEVVAKVLETELDLLLVRKIGVPWQPELALAAVVENHGPETVINREVTNLISIPPDYLPKQVAREFREIEVRRQRYLGGRPRTPVQGRVVVVVDDGIATGTTMSASLRALRRQQPARLIVAIPVGPSDALERLKAEADEVVCLVTPDDFFAVGAHYVDFTQVDDEEVIAVFARRYGAAEAPSQPPAGQEPNRSGPDAAGRT